MSTSKWIAVRADGSHTAHTTAAAARRAAKRSTGTKVVVDLYPEADPPPYGSSDASVWDEYRTRHGYAGGP